MRIKNKEQMLSFIQLIADEDSLHKEVRKFIDTYSSRVTEANVVYTGGRFGPGGGRLVFNNSIGRLDVTPNETFSFSPLKGGYISFRKVELLSLLTELIKR